jgi:anti-anti-sigma factor
MSDDIKVVIQDYNSDTAIINLAGDVTTFAETPINDAYRAVSDKGVKNIIFNFRENDYINSAGIAILIGVVTEARKKDQRLLISMPSAHFRKIFRMVGLPQFAEIFEELEAAKSAA